MMHEDGEQLFSKNVNVLLKDYDQKVITLNITIYNTHASSPGHRRELYFRLTNSADLLFLQTLTLSEDDFQSLKNQQGLLVDYTAFAQKFIDLLELCIKDQYSNVPRFILHLTTGSLNTSHGVLEVVETNPFKHLVHLSLKFVPGNDDEIKHYLAACLKLVIDEKELMQKQLTETEKDLSCKLLNAQTSLKGKLEELETTKKQWQDKLTKVKEKYEEELSKEKDNAAQLCQTYENRLQNENRSNGDRYNNIVGDLETKLNALQASNKVLTDYKYKYESLIRDLKSQLATLDEERQVRSKDVEKLRLQNHHLDNERHERDKTLNHLKTRVAILEQELKNKENVNDKNNQLMENTSEQKNRLEVELEKKNSQIAQLESSVSSVSSEVIKGNEIIKKLQMEIKSLKSRVKMMSIVTAKQEKLIEEKDMSLLHFEKEKSTNHELVTKLQDKISQLTVSAEETSQKLSESQETLKNNENVINWLNKQLNEHTMSRLSSCHNTTTRNNSSMGNNNGRTPFSARTFNSGTNNTRNSHPMLLGKMPYGGNTFGRPRFQNENISPIVSLPHNEVHEKQQNSTPVIHEEPGPVLDPKYLMRQRTEKNDNSETPKHKLCGSEENIDPKALHTEMVTTEMLTASSHSPKPYIIPSSYFPSKGNA